MRYKKIKVMSKDDPKRLYRLMYVREDLNLFQMGVAILVAFDCSPGHTFSIYDAKYEYTDYAYFDDEPEEYKTTFMALLDLLLPEQKDYEKYKMSDLKLKSNQTFELHYDPAHDWQFDIRVYKAEKDLDTDVYGRVIEGAGASIWDDNHPAFWKLLEEGAEAFTDEEKEDLLEESNIDVDKFDDPLDLDDLNEGLEYAEGSCNYIFMLREF